MLSVYLQTAQPLLHLAHSRRLTQWRPLVCTTAGFVVIDENNQTMFAVDVGEPSVVLNVLKEEETAKKREFLGILTTHKHACVP